MKSIIKGRTILVKHDIVFQHRFKEYVINDSVYFKTNQQTIESIIHEFFNNDYKLKPNINDIKFNSVVKVLYDKNIGIDQEDFTGEFYIDKSKFVQLILNPATKDMR